MRVYSPATGSFQASAQQAPLASAFAPAVQVPSPADALTLRFGTVPAAASKSIDIEARSKSFTITGSSGNPIRMREWSPSANVSPRRPTEGPPILLVHGGVSRASWLSPLAWRLVDKHPNVYGIDLKNIAYAENNVGRIASHEELTTELKDAATWLQKKHGQPVFIAAHSIGALIATAVAIQQSQQRDEQQRAGQKPEPPLIKGLILMAPTYEGTTTAPDILKNVLYLKRLMLEKLGFAQEPLSLPSSHRMENLTDNPEKHELLKTAEDKVTRFTATSWDQLHQLSRWVAEHKHDVASSVLMFAPGDDVVASLPAMIDRFNGFVSWDKQLTTFSEAKHDLVWEPVMPQMADVINRWVATRSVKVL